MDYKYCCVVDAGGRYKTFVLVEGERVRHYELEPGERLLEVSAPPLRPHAGGAGLISPRWNTAAWEEDASPEEAVAWEKAHPAPEAAEGADPAADTDGLLVEHEYRLALLELGLGEGG